MVIPHTFKQQVNTVLSAVITVSACAAAAVHTTIIVYYQVKALILPQRHYHTLTGECIWKSGHP